MGSYILLCLRTPNHGYGIVQKVKELTENEVVLGPGTMYGSLSKMEKDGLIEFIREEEKRRKYFLQFAVKYISFRNRMIKS